jgi:hypothetical protein
MKKLLALIMALVMALSLAACSGENAEPAQGSSSETSNTETEIVSKEAELVSKTFGNITINVPSDFSDVIEKDGLYISASPTNANIVVSRALGIDIQASEWNESVAEQSLQAYSSAYTDMELLAFEGNVNMNGNTAVFLGFTGKLADDTECIVQVVRLYNADETAMYMIAFTHRADDEAFTAELSGEIINSITLSPDAQNLKAEFEG